MVALGVGGACAKEEQVLSRQHVVSAHPSSGSLTFKQSLCAPSASLDARRWAGCAGSSSALLCPVHAFVPAFPPVSPPQNVQSQDIAASPARGGLGSTHVFKPRHLSQMP